MFDHFCGLPLHPFLLSMIFLNCGDQNWKRYSSCDLTSTEKTGMIPFIPVLIVSLGMQIRISSVSVAPDLCLFRFPTRPSQQGCFKNSQPQLLLSSLVMSSQVQACHFVKLQIFLDSPLFQPVRLSLQGCLSLVKCPCHHAAW